MTASSILSPFGTKLLLTASASSLLSSGDTKGDLQDMAAAMVRMGPRQEKMHA